MPGVSLEQRSHRCHALHFVRIRHRAISSSCLVLSLSRSLCLKGRYKLMVICLLNSNSVFTWIASTTESMLIKLLENPETIDRFTKTNQKRLAESYTLTVNTLRAHRIPYIPAQGGHFIWIDLRQFIPPSLVNIAAAGDRGAEYRLFNSMLDQGVYVNLGEAFTEKKVGFFRLSFSVPLPMLKIGLERLIKACQATLESLDDRN